MIGAIAKSGSMPFHSWIPDAALDAPLPFMAIIPGALEKYGSSMDAVAFPAEGPAARASRAFPSTFPASKSGALSLQ
jgi:hypothetical protein